MTRYLSVERESVTISTTLMNVEVAVVSIIPHTEIRFVIALLGNIRSRTMATTAFQSSPKVNSFDSSFHPN